MDFTWVWFEFGNIYDFCPCDNRGCSCNKRNNNIAITPDRAEGWPRVCPVPTFSPGLLSWILGVRRAYKWALLNNFILAIGPRYRFFYIYTCATVVVYSGKKRRRLRRIKFSHKNQIFSQISQAETSDSTLNSRVVITIMLHVNKSSAPRQGAKLGSGEL